MCLRQPLKGNIETLSHERLTLAFKGGAEGVLNRSFWEAYGVKSEQHSECLRQSLKERSHREAERHNNRKAETMKEGKHS